MASTTNNNIIKIAALNLCQELKSKKLEVENILTENNIDILCLQEVEIDTTFDQILLKIKNYQFELETNSEKSRTGIYLSNALEYRRMKNLEGTDSNLIIVDIVSSSTVKRIINVYRTFNRACLKRRHVYSNIINIII